jgi:transcriptional regulator with XRE-family HTH domain
LNTVQEDIVVREDFATWFRVELARRHLSRKEVAELGGISEGSLDLVAKGRLPGADVATGIAKAFNAADAAMNIPQRITVEEVFRRAGILPPPGNGEWSARLKELGGRTMQLTEAEQETVLDVWEMALRLAEMRHRPIQAGNGEQR